MKHQLRAIKQAGRMAFTLQLPTSAGLVPLDCFRIIRCLPGKRLACLADWQERTVFVKLFVDPRRAKVHWQRETKGNRALLDRCILTPSLVYSGRLDDDGIYLSMFEYIPNGQSALERWQASAEAERLNLLFELSDVLAGHHHQGIVQTDLHLDNFLCVQERIYTLDCADIVASAKPLPKTSALKNLALFFAQLQSDEDHRVDAVYRHYSATRGWADAQRDRERLQVYIKHKRNKRQRHLFKRIFRECRDFSCRDTWFNFTVYDKTDASPALTTLLDNLELAILTGEPLKLGNTATVVRVTIEGRTFVVKRYNIKNWRHAIKRACRPTRAATSWRNAHRLVFYGISTPRPVALIERRFGPIRRTAYFITESIAGIDCRTYFIDSPVDDRHKDTIAGQVATLLKKLHRQRISHGDLKATNFLIADETAFLIDLDAMKEHRFLFCFRRCWRRDMKRFFKNWQAIPAVDTLFRRLLSGYF